MKKILYILLFSFSFIGVHAQEDDGNDATVRERMVQYMQEKLGLTKSESDRFTPVFVNYLKELRRTNQEFRGDRLVLQQKIAELRLRYRDQFKPIIGEKRSNDVFVHAHDFIQKAKEERDQRMKSRKDGAANKRFRGEL